MSSDHMEGENDAGAGPVLFLVGPDDPQSREEPRGAKTGARPNVARAAMGGGESKGERLERTGRFQGER